MINVENTIENLHSCTSIDELNFVLQLYIRAARLDLDRVKKFYDSRRAELCAPVADQIISFPTGRPARAGRGPHMKGGEENAEAHAPVYVLR